MSAEKILEKIIADANADAEETLQKARDEAAARMAEARTAAQNRRAAIERKAEADAAETERRRMLTASLDSRKNTLAKRRALLDRAFDDALAAFLKLSDDEYISLVKKLAVSAAETGREAIVVPEGDEKRYTKPFSDGKTMLELLNQALKAAGKPGSLTFGGTSSGFSGGLMLAGEITDIDCSFESLIAQFREENEMEAAAILFERGV